MVDYFAPLLAPLPAGSQVAVVFMRGSLCPITLGHVQGFVEARKILLGGPGVARPSKLEHFSEVLGLFTLNSDQHVGVKMSEKGDPLISSVARSKLIWLSIADYPWMAYTEGGSFRKPTNIAGALESRFGYIHFIHFALNGADDVFRYRKWSQSNKDNRHITMGRSGDTEKVISAAKKYGIDFDDNHFIMGPELPDISSTLARKYLKEGNRAGLQGLLHPRVIEWCFANEPYKLVEQKLEAKTPEITETPKPQFPVVVHRRQDSITRTALRLEPTREQRAFTDTLIRNGERVRLITLGQDENFAWVQRVDAATKEGFIQTAHLELLVKVCTGTFKDSWNLSPTLEQVSSSSGVSSETSSSLRVGDEVLLVAVKPDFVLVRKKSGEEGWVSTRLFSA